jgi:hypothetical protein
MNQIEKTVQDRYGFIRPDAVYDGQFGNLIQDQDCQYPPD